MTSLLDQVIEAHGGAALWNAYERLTATIVTGGALWGIKGLTQDPAPRTMRVALHYEWASVEPYGAPGQRTDFRPGRIAILREDGRVIAERVDPRASFADHDMHTPWDPLDRAYFNGYALWTYLTTPFLLRMDGVRVEEIEPWREAGETWRGLRAAFPDAIASHSREQDFYFGEDGRLRRHDYRVGIAGGFAAAQYVGGYVEASGLAFPTRRVAYARADDLRPIRETQLVTIDLSDFRPE